MPHTATTDRCDSHLRTVNAGELIVWVLLAWPLPLRAGMEIQGIQPPLIEVVRRIESEYREMPGLCLTEAQAQRLWGLDQATCVHVLRVLVTRRILKRTKAGLYLQER